MFSPTDSADPAATTEHEIFSWGANGWVRKLTPCAGPDAVAGSGGSARDHLGEMIVNRCQSLAIAALSVIYAARLDADLTQARVLIGSRGVI